MVAQDTYKKFMQEDRLPGIPTLYMLVALPRSGKSSWANERYKKLQATIVSGDDLRRVFGVKFDPSIEDAVQRILKIETVALLIRGQDVILDCCNHTVDHRRQWFNIAADCGARVILVTFPQPERKEWKQRCKRTGFKWSVLKKFQRENEPITKQEENEALVVWRKDYYIFE